MHILVQHFSGMDEAVFRNINACKELSRVTRSSYGPNGMNKMVINHLEKLFVTNDAATIIKELDVEHPAAKMIVMATKMMEQEVKIGMEYIELLCYNYEVGWGESAQSSQVEVQNTNLYVCICAGWRWD